MKYIPLLFLVIAGCSSTTAPTAVNATATRDGVAWNIDSVQFSVDAKIYTVTLFHYEGAKAKASTFSFSVEGSHEGTFSEPAMFIDLSGAAPRTMTGTGKIVVDAIQNFTVDFDVNVADSISITHFIGHAQQR